MFIIWILGVIILGSIAAYYLGQMDQYDFEEAFWVAVAGVFFWPAILIVGLIMSPFMIPFILGRRKANKDKTNG